ncbi:MAG: hypothetical protein KAJ52_07905 [Sedimentisphaerales bacterium]|nr:hypothetical protein [Sedimentisphaerales bacterium]
MDNNKKLLEGLLKADGIDPANITESERMVFRQMLEREKKRMNRLSWRGIAMVWIFVIAILGLCVSEQILETFHMEALHIPFIVAWCGLMAMMCFIFITRFPPHNRKLKESNKKISKLYYLVHGKHRGVVMVGRKDGRRVINWPGILRVTVVIWMIISLSGAGMYYLLCQCWIYSSSPWFHIFDCTVISLLFVIFLLREGLKTPLDELVEVKAQSKQSKFGITWPDTWRLIMQSKITKLATAAAVIIALVIGMNFFNSSPDGDGIAWGDVKTAFMNQNWVYVKYDNGREEWHNLNTGTVFHKYEGGTLDVLSRDYTHIYNLGMNSIREHRKGKATMTWQNRSAWDVIVGPLEKSSIKSSNAKYPYHVEKHTETIAGQELVRFDVYELDAFDNKILTQQLWADPQTQLPVRIRRKHRASDREKHGSDYTTGNFDFPKTGPVTIYDLGAPENLEIVNTREREEHTSLEASQVIQKSKEYSENFVEHYLAVIWEDTGKNGISFVNVIYRNGNKIHVSTYMFNQHILKQEHIDRHLTADDILERTQYNECMSVYIFDGEREYKCRNSLSHWNEADNQARVVIRRAKRPIGLQLWFRIEIRLWPHVGWAKGRHCEVVFDHPDNPAGCVTIQADKERFFFVNPEKNYLAVGRIRMETINGILQKFMETWWSDFKQLPTGHWYPTRECFTSYGNPERGTRGHEENRNIHIQLLEENEFPADVFNGKKLLEGAKVETY